MLLHCRCTGDVCNCETPSGEKVRVKLPGTIVCRSREAAVYVREDDVDIDEVVLRGSRLRMPGKPPGMIYQGGRLPPIALTQAAESLDISAILHQIAAHCMEQT
jgi:hypothetical protein